MAFVVKTAKTLRNHWKKSTFFTIVITYGVNYLKDRRRSEILMRAYCSEAKRFGDVPLPTGKKPRHITVILNPAAKDGKGKKLFESYAAPLLYLAGLKVNVVQTDHEGQAKGLMEVMENTDAVVIAGGDGTLSDAVTGLLRRNDGDIASKRFPIGVIPIGQTNTVARTLFWSSHSTQVRWIADACMAVIKEVQQPMDVMYIEPDDPTGKPVYAIGKIDWGIFRDVNARVNKYWYWGPLRSQMAYIFTALKSWPSSVDVNLAYTLPCPGCSKCKGLQEQSTTAQESSPPVTQRWWHAFIRTKPIVTTPVETTVDYSGIVNEECGVWKTKKTRAVELTIATKNAFRQSSDITDPHLQIQIVPQNLTRSQFFTQGLNHLRDGKVSEEMCTSLQAREIQLRPRVEKGVDKWYSIDSEQFEMKPITIKLLPNKVHFYCLHNQIHSE